MSIVNDDIGVTVGTDVIIRISSIEDKETPTKLSRYRLLLGKLYAAAAMLTDKVDEMNIEGTMTDEKSNLPKRPSA